MLVARADDRSRSSLGLCDRNSDNRDEHCNDRQRGQQLAQAEGSDRMGGMHIKIHRMQGWYHAGPSSFLGLTSLVSLGDGVRDTCGGAERHDDQEPALNRVLGCRWIGMSQEGLGEIDEGLGDLSSEDHRAGHR